MLPEHLVLLPFEAELVLLLYQPELRSHEMAERVFVIVEMFRQMRKVREKREHTFKTRLLVRDPEKWYVQMSSLMPSANLKISKAQLDAHYKM